jgi:hypothetical protein
MIQHIAAFFYHVPALSVKFAVPNLAQKAFKLKRSEAISHGEDFLSMRNDWVTFSKLLISPATRRNEFGLRLSHSK